jgi:hypothetical protein
MRDIRASQYFTRQYASQKTEKEAVMQTLRFRIVHVFAVVGFVAIVASLATLSGRSQSPAAKTEQQNPKTESLVKPTVLTTERRAANAGSVTIAPFADAAAQNSLLRNDLTWSFGKKGQRGWYLYDLLIGETLNISHNASSVDFAATIAGWQKQKGLSASGILDEDSWMALVMQWQANRLKDKTPATPDQLLTAPTSEFYDPSRLDELRQVERNTYTAYKAMLAAAIADPTLKLAHTSPSELASTEKFFKIVSSFRSREYQEKLRRESPNASGRLR